MTAAMWEMGPWNCSNCRQATKIQSDHPEARSLIVQVGPSMRTSNHNQSDRNLAGLKIWLYLYSVQHEMKDPHLLPKPPDTPSNVKSKVHTVINTVLKYVITLTELFFFSDTLLHKVTLILTWDLPVANT